MQLSRRGIISDSAGDAIATIQRTDQCSAGISPRMGREHPRFVTDPNMSEREMSEREPSSVMCCCDDPWVAAARREAESAKPHRRILGVKS